MIFNPLYFSENGNSHMLVANSSKLSNKQYLFSDIVKVIMNTDRVQKKIMETGLDKIAKNQHPTISGIESDSKQIKFKELTQKDHNKVKTDLADILPPEIAQLLMNNAVIKNGEALSYISEEPLEGELENFIKGLIGEDILAKNITKDTGLFLHLEDAKSAVNIELKKVSDPNLTQSKVLVQTLVVPEKSKLISLFKTYGVEGNLANLSKEKLTLNLSLSHLDMQNNEAVKNSEKPTLSVYSFKNPEIQTDSFNGKNNENIKLEFVNTNLIASSKNNLTSNMTLNKIGIIPTESTQNEAEMNNVKNENANSNQKNNESAKTNNDFSITKITIVKKQNDSVNNSIEKLNTENKKIDSNLRAINFNGKFNSNNNELTLLKTNLKNISNDQTKIWNLKGEVSENITKQDSKSVVKENTNDNNSEKINNAFAKNNSNDSVKNSNNGEVKNEQSPNSKILTGDNIKLSQIEFSTNLDKGILSQNEEVVENSDKTENKVKVVNDEIKQDLKDTLNNQKTSESGVRDELKKVISEIGNNIKNINEKDTSPERISLKNNIDKNIEIKNDQNQSGKTKESTVISQESKRNSEAFSKNVENSSNKIEGKTSGTSSENAKTETFIQKSDNSSQKIDSDHPKSNDVTKQNISDSKNDKSIQSADKTNDISQNKIIVSVNDETNNDQLNKKITIKVRNEVKSVTNKVDDGSKNISDQTNSNSTNNSNNENEESLKDSNKSSIHIGDKNTFKNDHEININHSFKDEIVKEIDSVKHISTENASSNTQKYVKSTEVMKEITKFITKQEKGTLSFDIKPEHLGKMKITIDTIDHAVKATIQVDNENAKSLVEKNIQKLHQELSNNGVQLNSISISLGQPKNNRNDRHNLNKTGNNNSRYRQDDLESAEENVKQKSLGYNTYEYIA